MKVGFISLGCSKNLIDTEIIIGKFKNHKYQIVNKAEEAEILIINTCGFIDSAKEEGINTILEMAEYKKRKCKYLIVTGCLVQRYYEDLIKLIPEVDLFVKIDEYDKIWEKIENLITSDIVEKAKTKPMKKASEIRQLPMFNEKEFNDRVVSTGTNYAYVKIGEGCSNLCTYCAIPYIRGKFISRKEEEILEEIKMLANKGIKEIILIAQDTTKYGIDIYGESKLAELLNKVTKIEGIKWVRFLYSYPEGITEELIETVANNDKIAKYFDIPIQHISDRILKLMNRKTSKKDINNLINKIRNRIPDVTLRTSLIVGFPGETKEDFQELEEFVEKTKFDKLGVFKYSKEEGTPAARLPKQIHGNTKRARHNKIMSKQQEISKENLEKKIGKEYEVLIEEISFDKKYYIGRTLNDVPEEDGVVYISNPSKTNTYLNKFIKCKITEVSNYDLIGLIKEGE